MGKDVGTEGNQESAVAGPVGTGERSRPPSVCDCGGTLQPQGMFGRLRIAASVGARSFCPFRREDLADLQTPGCVRPALVGCLRSGP
jgi:hypothetical protein